MNIKISYFLILFSVLLTITSCNNEKKKENISEPKIANNEYLILGNLKNVADSTWIYINQDNNLIDSTQIINEKFEFRGSVKEPTSFFMIVGKFKPDFFTLWAENKEIKIKGEKGNLREAIIIAGETQRESLLTKPITDSIFQKIKDGQKPLRNRQLNKQLSKSERDSLIQHQNKLLDEIRKIYQQFIIEHPDSYVSGDYLKTYNTSWDKKIVSKLYNNLSDRIKKSKNGKEIEHFLSLPETPKIGEKYIDFELPDTTGTLVRLSDNASTYTLVEFWASWCGPCIKENPKLVKTYNQYRDKGFEIIGISLDNTKKHWLKAIEKDKLPWINVSDLTGSKTKIALIYGVNGIPDNFLINEDGEIISKNLRGKQLEEKLKELFSVIDI